MDSGRPSRFTFADLWLSQPPWINPRIGSESEVHCTTEREPVWPKYATWYLRKVDLRWSVSQSVSEDARRLVWAVGHHQHRFWRRKQENDINSISKYWQYYLYTLVVLRNGKGVELVGSNLNEKSSESPSPLLVWSADGWMVWSVDMAKRDPRGQLL